MSLQKNKKGRPKKQQTIAREQAEAWLKNVPDYAKLSAAEQSSLARSQIASEEARQSLLKGYSAAIPEDLIYALNSIGDRELFEEDEWIVECERKVIEKYEKAEKAVSDGSSKGGAATSQKAFNQAKAFWEKNPELFEAMNRPRNADTTAHRIVDNWHKFGNGSPVPSTNTIKNWHKLIQNSKGLLGKK